MMEILVRAEARKAQVPLEVESAGTIAEPGCGASDPTVACMKTAGFAKDIAQHQSRRVDSLDLARYDVFMCMTIHHARALQDLGVDASRIQIINSRSGGVEDPFGKPLSKYEECASVLAEAAKEFVAGL
jgi:protein-tyrosine-phosphatase